MTRSNRTNTSSNAYWDETQAEVHFLDEAQEGTVVNSKAVIYSGACHIQATTLTSTGNVSAGTNQSNTHQINGALVGMQREYEDVTVDTDVKVNESGKLFVFSDADGATCTLPDSGAGDIIGVYYDFLIVVSATSNYHRVTARDTSNENV